MKPTSDEYDELLKLEANNIRELLNSPLGLDFVRHLRGIQSLTRMFDQDPYLMAYRCAVHDVIGRILDLAEPNDGR